MNRLAASRVAIWLVAMLLPISLTAFVAGCDREPSESREPPPRVEEVNAQQLFMRKCARCHGERGRGDGPGARSYARVANLREAELQSRLSDEQISSVITDGKGQMPPVYGLHPVEVGVLVGYVRGLADDDQTP